MIGIIILTVTALLLSIILVIIDSKLNKKSSKHEEILKLLPGYNCGACGFGSCEGMCNAIIKDLDNYKKCKPLRGESLTKMEEYIKNLRTNKE